MRPVFGGAHAPRISLYRQRRRCRGGSRRRPGAADRADHPDASTIAAGAPIEVGLAPIADGQIIKVFWRSKPIFNFHRTKKDITKRDAQLASLPASGAGSWSASRKGHCTERLVVIGICMYLYLSARPQGELAPGREFCPCHGSQYDTSGRTRKGPKRKNLFLFQVRFRAPRLQIG